MRIFVVETDGAGGMIHYAHQMCGALARAGADVTLITGVHYELAHLDAPFQVRPVLRLWPAIEPPLDGRFAGLRRRLRRVGRAIRLVREWARLSRILLSERPDVVQFAIIRFPFLGLFLRRLRSKGLTLTQISHEIEPRESSRRVRSLMRRASAPVVGQFEAVFVHGEANRALLLETTGIDADRVHVIPHGDESLFLHPSDGGGDLKERYEIPEGRGVVLFFGGMRPSKGLEGLIRAVAIAAGEVDCHLIIAGQPAGTEPAELRRLASTLGIGDRVAVDARYVPFDEVGALMRTAAIVALPYLSATASGVLQVAYAFERPVVATALGALGEDVIDGETGLLVPPGDESALSRALIKLLSDPAEAKLMGRAGARLAEQRYSWDPIAAAILTVYEEVAA